MGIMLVVNCFGTFKWFFNLWTDSRQYCRVLISSIPCCFLPLEITFRGDDKYGVFLNRDRFFFHRQTDRHVLAQCLFRRGRRVQYHRRQLQLPERTATGVRQLRSVVGRNEKGIRHHVSTPESGFIHKHPRAYV